MFNRVFEKFGISYSDLTDAEKQSMRQMQESLSKARMDSEEVREHIEDMIDEVTLELTEIGEHNWNPYYIWRRRAELRARLRNYTLLKRVLTRPDKMRKAMKENLEASLRMSQGTEGGIINQT